MGYWHWESKKCELFVYLYNMDKQEQVAAHMRGFDGVQRSNYFGGEPNKKTKVEIRVRKLKN